MPNTLTWQNSMPYLFLIPASHKSILGRVGCLRARQAVRQACLSWAVHPLEPEQTAVGCRLVEGIELLAHLLHPKRAPHPEGVPQALKLQLNGAQRCRQRLLPNYFTPFP